MNETRGFSKHAAHEHARVQAEPVGTVAVAVLPNAELLRQVIVKQNLAVRGTIMMVRQRWATGPKRTS